MRGNSSMAKAVDAGLRHGAQRIVVAVRIHDGDDDRALLQTRKLGRLRPPHLEHDIGAAHRIGGHGGAGGGIVRIEDAGFDPGARLDRDFGAKPDHFLDGFGSRGYARLARIGFGSNRNLHKSSDGGTAGNQADVGLWGSDQRCSDQQNRPNQPKKYAIRMTIVTMTAIITFTKVMKFWYVCS